MPNYNSNNKPSGGVDTLFLRFQSGFGWIAALRLAGILSLFALTVLVGRCLGPAGQGVYAVALAATGLAVQLGNCGLHAANTYFTARQLSRAAPLTSHSLLWAGLAGSVLGTGMVVVTRSFPHLAGDVDPAYIALFSFAVPFMLAALFLQGVLLGLDRTRAYLGIEVISRMGLLLAAAVFLLILGTGLHSFVWLWTIAQIATGAGYAIYVRHAIGGQASGFNRDLLKSSLQYGIKAYLTSLFGFLVLRSDILLVNFFGGTTAGGIYSVAALLSEQMLVLPALFGTALFPLVSGDQLHGRDLTLKVMRHLTPLLFLVCGLGLVLAQPLVIFFYGRAFEAAGVAFLWLLPGVFLLSLQVVLAHHLAGVGYPRQMVYLWGAGFAFNLLVNLYVIPRWGMLAAAVTSSVTYALMFLLVLRLFRAHTGASLPELFQLRREEIKQLAYVMTGTRSAKPE